MIRFEDETLTVQGREDLAIIKEALTRYRKDANWDYQVAEDEDKEFLERLRARLNLMIEFIDI